MRRVAIAIVIAALPGCSMHIAYERGAPLRVESRLVSTPGALRIGTREIAGQVEIAVDVRREVSVERRRVYQTWETRLEWSAWEVVAFPVELLMALTMPFMAPLFPTVRRVGANADYIAGSLSENVLVAGVSPAHALIHGTRAKSPSELERFATPTVRSEFEMALPLVGEPVQWAWLDEGRQTVAEGSGTTNAFGVTSARRPANATRLRIEVRGATSEATFAPCADGARSPAVSVGGESCR